MSPIIYTPHDCKTPAPQDVPYPHPVGTLWQCEVCETIWAARRPRIGEWDKIAEPRREHSIEDASRRAPAQPTTPTVTPGMVQLVLDTYTEHTELARDVFSGYTGCAVCGTGSYGPHTVRAHAREMAANVLQDALEKAGRDE